MKTKVELIQAIPDFRQFSEFISKFKDIVDTGRLAEFYCSRLFNLVLVKPHNSPIDAKDSKGGRIEIKQRFFSKRNGSPPGMKIDLDKIDYVLFVDLDENLLPVRIYKILKKDIQYASGKRVSFNKAFKGNKVEIVFESTQDTLRK